MSRPLRNIVVLLAVLSAIFSATAFASADAAPLKWSAPERIDNQPPFEDVAAPRVTCPSTSLCVGVDDFGNVLTSTNPTGGAGTWTWVRTCDARSFGNGFTAVSCPSITLCVAVDQDGNVTTSTNPTGGANAWSVGHVSPSDGFQSVSCPSTSFLHRDRWRRKSPATRPSASSTHPADGASAWQMIEVGGGAAFSRLLLVHDALCCAIDESGSVYTSTNPTGGSSGSWAKAELPGTPTLNAVSCAASLCVVGSESGVFTSTNPTGGTGAWTATAIGAVRGVSCPKQASFCAAVKFNTVITSTNPTGGLGAWSGSERLWPKTWPAISLARRPAFALSRKGPNFIYSTNPTSS